MPLSQHLCNCCRLIVFFAVYIGIIQNFRFSRYVRYNAAQAIVLDVILMWVVQAARLAFGHAHDVEEVHVVVSLSHE